MASDEYPLTGDSSGIWPFLVGSGRTVGQRVILAPDFLLAGKSSALLLTAVRSPEVPRSGSPGSATWRRHVLGGGAAGFLVIFRVVRASPALVGKAGDDLLDSGSRPVYLAEGVVLNGADGTITESDLARAHNVSMAAFLEFWEADDRFSQPVASRPLPRSEPVGGDSPLTAIELPAIVGRAEIPPPVQPDDLPHEKQEKQEKREKQPESQAHITIGPGFLLAVAVVIAIVILIYFLSAR
jgi:hypothetical protein